MRLVLKLALPIFGNSDHPADFGAPKWYREVVLYVFFLFSKVEIMPLARLTI